MGRFDREYISKTNKIRLIFIVLLSPKDTNFCAVIQLTSVKIPDTLPKLSIKHNSNLSGTIQPVDYDGESNIPSQDCFGTLTIPQGYVIFLSVINFDSLNTTALDQTLWVYTDDQPYYAIYDYTELYFPKVLNARELSFRFTYSSSKASTLGFQFRFSFILPAVAPRQSLSDYQYLDCSGSNYESFKGHVECNLRFECEDGRDEKACHYTHPACNGNLNLRNKCYVFVEEKQVPIYFLIFFIFRLVQLSNFLSFV